MCTWVFPSLTTNLSYDNVNIPCECGCSGPFELPPIYDQLGADPLTSFSFYENNWTLWYELWRTNQTKQNNIRYPLWISTKLHLAVICEILLHLTLTFCTIFIPLSYYFHKICYNFPIVFHTYFGNLKPHQCL